jgi:hypothetical protein
MLANLRTTSIVPSTHQCSAVVIGTVAASNGMPAIKTLIFPRKMMTLEKM